MAKKVKTDKPQSEKPVPTEKPDETNAETVVENHEENNDNVEKTVENQEENNDNVEFAPKIGFVGAGKIAVCIPFIASAAQGNELKYALRSMERNFREDFMVVIIGDRPDWLSNEALHIGVEKTSKNPQIDTTNKLYQAIAADVVSDKFVWTNDNIYFNSPVIMADIEALSAQGKLLEIPGATETYKANRNDTIALLRKMKLDTVNFDMHTPVCFEKEKLVELFEELQQMNAPEGVLIPSVYFNKFFAGFSASQHDGKSGNYLLRIISANPDAKLFSEFVKGKKFLNNAESGWCKLLQDYLQKRFPEKSKFEI